MRKLYMMIGLPRSGKSTWTEAHTEGAVVVSADRFRRLMYGQRYYAEGEGMMWAVRDIFLKELLSQGVSIIVDETNIDIATRAKLIKLAKKHGYEVIGVWHNVPINECKARAEWTNQMDLIPIIDKMVDKFEVPRIEEGFDRLEAITEGYVRAYGKSY